MKSTNEGAEVHKKWIVYMQVTPKKEHDMKRLLTALITVVLVMGSVGFAQRLPWLTGQVTYAGGGDVGSGRMVKVYLSQETAEYDSIWTQANGWYRYSFDPPQYFVQVSCRFRESGSWYSGRHLLMTHFGSIPELTLSYMKNNG